MGGSSSNLESPDRPGLRTELRAPSLSLAAETNGLFLSTCPWLVMTLSQIGSQLMKTLVLNLRNAGTIKDHKDGPGDFNGSLWSV